MLGRGFADNRLMTLFIITLLAGSSGTLITPMAANFNVVPTALLNMRDQYGVIKFQLPFGLMIWSLHVLLMWTLIRMFGW